MNTKHTTVRIPEDIYHQVKDVAEKDNRKFSNQLTVILREWVAARAVPTNEK